MLASQTYGISLSQYRGLSGFNFGIGADLAQFGVTNDDIQKALSAGTQHPPTDGGNVLRVQSLEAVMRVLTYRAEHLVFWRRIPKNPAYNTVIEYNVLESYGDAQSGAFLREGETPQSQDSAYRRMVTTLKYAGTQREVTHQATLVKSAHQTPTALETSNGTMWLLEKIERGSYSGDSSVVPEEFDGLERQIMSNATARQNNVLDLRGGVIKPEHIERANQIITQQFGFVNNLFLAPKAHTDISLQLLPLQRVLLNQAQNNTLGAVCEKFSTTNGEIPISSTVFLRSGNPSNVKQAKTYPTAATGPKAPLAPTITLAAVPGPVTGSLFTAADAGTWRYRVQAVNRSGQSPVSAEVSVVLAAATDAIQITITDGGSVDPMMPATGYRIWRTRVVNGLANTEEFMVAVPRNGLAATTVFVDLNEDLPGTSKAFMMSFDPAIMSWMQLLPLLKIALATTGPTLRWMQLLYGALIVYQPLKVYMIKNISDN